MHIRQNWITNTKFHAQPRSTVLKSVLTEIDKAVKGGEKAIVIFDLDSTLMDVSNRSYEILKEWSVHPETSTFLHTLEKLRDLSPRDMKYSLEDVWELKKIPYEEAPFDHHHRHAKQYWRKRFFSNDYLMHDKPTEGAVVFVNAAYELGAEIVYLTGRDVPLMAFGTYDQLRSHGFPIEKDRTRLILKPKRHIDDLDFKTGIAKMTQEWGKVIASFENEPKNLVAMAKVFKPETMNVFIETVSSDHPAPAAENIYRIDSFLMT